MELNKQQPGSPETVTSIASSITWGDGFRFPKRPVRLPVTDGIHSTLLPNGDIELDFILPALTSETELRHGAVMYAGDQRSGDHKTRSTKQHHVCDSGTCVHDDLPAPRVNGEQKTTTPVVPLWLAAL